MLAQRAQEQTMTPAEQYFLSAPASAFPNLPRAWEGPLLMPVRFGWIIRVFCWGCRRTVDFSGSDLCAHFAAWLTRPRADWARALRCGECGSKRLQIHERNDATAQGEFLGFGAHLSLAVSLLRLRTRLAEVGLSLMDFLPHLRDIPSPDRLRAVGLDEVAEALAARESSRAKASASITPRAACTASR